MINTTLEKRGVKRTLHGFGIRNQVYTRIKSHRTTQIHNQIKFATSTQHKQNK